MKKTRDLYASIKKSRQSLVGLPIQVWILVGVAFIAGLLLRGSGEPLPVIATVTEQAAISEVDWWTCSMHPQIKLSEPGQCPICFMDLIPVETTAGAGGLRELRMSHEAVAIAGIQTEPVHRAVAKREVRLSGTIAYDETRLGYITAWVPGRLENLFVDYTGISVNQGDHMVELYSPELYAAQEELIQALSRIPEDEQTLGRVSALATLHAAREKLRLLGLNANQIKEIERRGSPSNRITIYSPTSGVVIHKNAVEGMYVQTGTKIYTIADLSRIWVIMDAYESDLPWLHYGHEVIFTVEAIPGRQFHSRIAFIGPVLDARTRTVKVRLNIPNPGNLLKPGMFVRAVVHSVMGPDGRAINPTMAGKWVCPMHPEVVKNRFGKCDVCGMDLVKAEDLGIVNVPTREEQPLLIPASAVLITGKRAVVYIKKPDTIEPVFESREVTLGARAGDHYLIIEGLREGEEVVIHGNFKIDSAMQIAAKPSMMNPEGGIAMTGHAHHNMEADQRAMPDSAPSEPANQTVVPPPLKMKVTENFRMSLGEIHGSYFTAQTALSHNELRAATTALVDLRGRTMSLTAAESGLEEHAKEMWLKYRKALLNSTEHIQHWSSLEAARRDFEVISRIMIALEKSFGHSEDQTYREIFCSMAFDNAGAAWLQISGTVMNPYFGAKMLRCGETRAVYPPVSPGDTGKERLNHE